MTENIRINAVRSWALWTGRKDIIEEVFKSEAAAGSFYEKEPELFNKITVSLYGGLNENYRGMCSSLMSPWLDGVYRELAWKQGVKPAAFWPDNKPYAV